MFNGHTVHSSELYRAYNDLKDYVYRVSGMCYSGKCPYEGGGDFNNPHGGECTQPGFPTPPDAACIVGKWMCEDCLKKYPDMDNLCSKCHRYWIRKTSLPSLGPCLTRKVDGTKKVGF